MKSYMIALLVLTSATVVTAGEEKPAAPKKQKEKLICHTDNMTGSRVKVRRVCLTKTQWAELYENTRQGMDSFSRGSNQTAPALSDGAGSGPAPVPGGPQ